MTPDTVSAQVANTALASIRATLRLAVAIERMTVEHRKAWRERAARAPSRRQLFATVNAMTASLPPEHWTQPQAKGRVQ